MKPRNSEASGTREVPDNNKASGINEASETNRAPETIEDPGISKTLATSEAAETSKTPERSKASVETARRNLGELFTRTARLYTCGDAASVSQAEADMLMRSILYTLGINAAEGMTPQAIRILAAPDIQAAFRTAQAQLDQRTADTMALFETVCAELPSFESIALWDTLESIRHLPACYDARFAAHEVPCDIDYQLQDPVPDTFQGIDYVHEWLVRLHGEALRLQKYDFQKTCAKLERRCPDYRGLLVNLLDILEAPEPPAPQ